MTILEFRDIVIDKGLKSVKETYKEKDPRLAGGIEGFEKCKEFTTPQEFLDSIRASRKIEFSFRTEDNSEEYIKQRYISLQVEYVFERMKVAWNYAKPRIYHFPSVSARATIDYAKIVGVRGQ